MPHGYLQARFLFGVLTVIFAMSMTGSADAQTPSPTFKVLALAEEKSIHRPFVDAAKIWLARRFTESRRLIDMPRRSKASIACESFIWNLFKRQGVWYADGRKNRPSLGKNSLGTRDQTEARAGQRDHGIDIGLPEK